MPFSSERAKHIAPDDEVDEAIRDSFPASDPPAWNSLRAGPPRADRTKAAAANPVGQTIEDTRSSTDGHPRL